MTATNTISADHTLHLSELATTLALLVKPMNVSHGDRPLGTASA